MAYMYLINVSLVFIYFFILYISLIFLFRKRYSSDSKPFISFIVPAFNAGVHVRKSIESIYKSYPRECLEVIAIDDKSTDNTLKIFKELKEKYGFKLLMNKKNIGKVASVNKASDYAKGEIIIFLDADIEIDKIVFSEIIARLKKPNVVMTASMYSPDNDKLLSRFQGVEFGMSHAFSNALSPLSSIKSLYGGCMAIKREVFLELGKFNCAVVTEDTDLAFRVKEAGYKAEICRNTVMNDVPRTFPHLWKQKIRWNAGYHMELLRNFGTFLKHPISLSLNIIGYSLLVFGIIASIKNYPLFYQFYQVFLIQISQNSFFNA